MKSISHSSVLGRSRRGRRHVRYFCLGIVCAVSLVGCVSKSRYESVATEMDGLRTDLARGQAEVQALEQQRDAFEAEYNKQRKTFRDAQQKLAGQRASLSDADFKKKVEELDAQGDKIEKALNQRKSALDTGVSKAVGQIRTAMLRYQPVPARAWQGLTTLAERCERAGVLAAPTHAYAGETLHTTPLMELMKGLLVAIAAPERLPPEEIEAAFRIARRYAGAGKLQAAPFEGATHALLLDAGAPPVRSAEARSGPRVRFFSAGDAVAKIQHMIGQHELLDAAAGHFEAGTLVTTLTREISGLDAAGLREAHAIVASGRSIGKVVVTR